MYRKNDSMDSIKYCIIKRKGPPELESPSILNYATFCQYAGYVTGSQTTATPSGAIQM